MATLRTRSETKLTKKVVDALTEEAERGCQRTRKGCSWSAPC